MVGKRMEALNVKKNKDDNIYKNEALKRQDILVECQNGIIRIQMYKSQNKIVSKFVEKLRKYSILFKDILTFLGFSWLQIGFAYNIVLCCPKNQYSKNQINRIVLSHKNLLKKLKINI